MAKPTVFIGSSVEHKKLAETVQSLLDYDVIPVLWTQDTFEPSHSPLESLEVALEKIDFAVLVCAPEENDVTVKRGHEYKAVRDNIIFELGLCIGRLGRKRTFLISPRDVQLNLPSDLAGIFPETYDLSLLKDNPEAAFGPACGKIKRAISKLGALARGDITEANSESNEPDAEIEAKRTPDTKPLSDWSLSAFEWGYVTAYLDKDSDRKAAIDEAFGESPYAETDEAKAYWDSWKEYAALIADGSGHLSLVRTLSERFTESSRLQELLARFVEHYGNHEQAAELLEQALQKSDNVEAAYRIINRAITIKTGSDLQTRISAYLTKLNDLPKQNYDDNVRYLRAAQTLAKAAGLDEISKTIMEMILTMRPDDVFVRFNLAHEYSESGHHDLAVLHYDAIPISERSGAAWNNLGVAYNRKEIRGLAVDAYKQAAKKGATIADGNLAKLFQGAGFFAEARAQAEAAIALPDHDKLVVSALSSLQEAVVSEAAAKDALIAEGLTRQKVRRVVGQRAIIFQGADIEGDWKTPQGIMSITSSGQFEYNGTLEFVRETKKPGLGLIGSRVVNELIKLSVKLRRFGSSLEGTITRETPDTAFSLLGSIGREKKILLAISADGSTLSGIELDFEETPVLWTREPSLKAIAS